MMYPGERVKEILHVRHNSLNGFEDIYFLHSYRPFKFRKSRFAFEEYTAMTPK